MRSFNTNTPNRHFDLTPVMNNTSTTMDPSSAADLDLDLELDFDLDMLDSRGNDEIGAAFSPRPVRPGSMLPPLAKRGLLPPKVQPEDTKPITIDSNPRPPIRAPELAFLPPVEDPVPFPPSGKGYSFTSMKQYEKLRQPEPATIPSTAGLAPYQPSRQDPGLIDIPQEELKSIFTTRRAASQALSTPESTFSEEDSSSNMQGMMPAIPLEERQWSIPSIRMANQLGGSVTSCTTYTEEDDESLLMYRDDASLSSYGSYSHLTGADSSSTNTMNNPIQAVFVMDDPQAVFRTGLPQQQLRQSSGVGEEDDEDEDEEEEGMDTGDDSSLPEAPRGQAFSSRYHHHRRRERRKEQRERKALEWLRTVKAGKDDVAEAASSKFLTRRNDNIFTAQVLYDKPQKRLSATAVESRTFAFLAKDLEDDSCGGDDNSVVHKRAAFQEVFASPSPADN